jgi:hypothetical protein
MHTTSSLDRIARSASMMFASSPGFVRCAVRSHDPPVLEFVLATHKDAERFKTHLDLHSAETGFRHQIDPENPVLLLQYR